MSLPSPETLATKFEMTPRREDCLPTIWSIGPSGEKKDYIISPERYSLRSGGRKEDVLVVDVYNSGGQRVETFEFPQRLDPSNSVLVKDKKGNEDVRIRLKAGVVQIPLVTEDKEGDLTWVKASIWGPFLSPKGKPGNKAESDEVYRRMKELRGRLYEKKPQVSEAGERAQKPEKESGEEEEQKTHPVGVGWHVGLVRSHQEDSYGTPEKMGFAEDTHGIESKKPTPEQVERRGELYAVADGMGGHGFGEIASTVAVAELFNSFYSGNQGLFNAVASAEDLVNNKAGGSEMDTTLVAAIVDPENKKIQVANVGDSRAYLISQSEAEQITNDHTIPGELRKRNRLSEEEARKHPRRNVLTESVAKRSPPDMFERSYQPGEDHLLLCSDGLSEYVKSSEIYRIINQARSVQKASENLVKMALDRGGADNITALVVEL